MTTTNPQSRSEGPKDETKTRLDVMAPEVATGEMAGLDDAEAIHRSVADPEWFAVLFDRYADRIHAYIARRLGTQAADDALGETFLAAFGRLESYDLSQRLALPWLYGIATNLIARHRRGEERYLRALRRTGVDPLPEPMADRVLDRVAAGEHERRLAGALASLSPSERDVLLLLAWGDLAYEEIAQALDIPIGTVRSRLHRARRKVQDRLGTSTLED